MPWRWAALTASARAMASESSRSIANPRGGICLLRVSPSTCSMVRKRIPSASSMEYRVTIPGWLSEATAFASRSKRAIFSGCDAISGGSTLRATRRESVECSARYTCPMPPEPSDSRMR